MTTRLPISISYACSIGNESLSPAVFKIFSPNSLSLSGACQVDLAVSTSSRHADLSNARRLAVARPKLRGRRSSSTVLSQDCLGLPTLRHQYLGGPRMHDWRAWEWSWLGSARLRCPKKDRWRPWIVSDKNGCPVRDRTHDNKRTYTNKHNKLQYLLAEVITVVLLAAGIQCQGYHQLIWSMTQLTDICGHYHRRSSHMYSRCSVFGYSGCLVGSYHVNAFILLAG